MKRCYAMVLLILILGSRCAPKNDLYSHDKVEAFLNSFQQNLLSSDEDILKQFKVNKDPEVILKAIRIMQDGQQNEPEITCTIDLDNAKITSEVAGVNVLIPSQFEYVGDTDNIIKETQFSLQLTSLGGIMYITKIDAEDFYKTYKSMLNEISHLDLEENFSYRQQFIEMASPLYNSYDSVVWYTTYNDSTYFYVVNGEWIDPQVGQCDNCKMGLVSETGRIVIPPLYDLVGTIGVMTSDVIEVVDGEYVGQYSIDGELLVPATYDWIVTSPGESYAYVMKDSSPGWLDEKRQFNTGFEDERHETYLKEFSYFDYPIKLGVNYVTLIETLSYSNEERGFVVMPNFLIDKIQVPRFISDFSIGASSEIGQQYVTFEKSSFEKLTDKLSFFLLSFESLYLDGREGFYRSHEIVFTAEDQVVGKFDTEIEESYPQRIDSNLFEYNATMSKEEAQYYWVPNDTTEWNPPCFRYFSYNEDTRSVIELTSNREFAFTEFVKIDSTYLQGRFVFWDHQLNDFTERDFVSSQTIREMRDEIVASYGYIFEDEVLQEKFEEQKWYKPKYHKKEEILELLTEIDRHNLTFLDNVLALIDKRAEAEERTVE